MAIIGRLNRSSMTAMVDPETSLKEHSFFAGRAGGVKQKG
jgi:hypothetical protein